MTLTIDKGVKMDKRYILLMSGVVLISLLIVIMIDRTFVTQEKFEIQDIEIIYDS